MANVSHSELKRFIKYILKDADLSKLSSRMIRRRCEEEFNIDLTLRKQEIDKIIMGCIDERAGGKEQKTSDDSSASESCESSSDEIEKDVMQVTSKNIKKPSPEKASNNKASREKVAHEKIPKVAKKSATPKQNATPKQSATPQQKKIDAAHSASDLEDPDAAIARKLQDEEWNFRHRSVKKMVTRRPAAKGESGDKPKVRKGNSSYTRKCLLSAELAAVLDANEMARHDVVKKMWSIVRERNLLDPANKQFALCDDQLQKVFGAKRIRMFGMMKYLKHHVKDVK